MPAGGGYTVAATDGAGTAQQTGVSVSSGTTTNVTADDAGRDGQDHHTEEVQGRLLCTNVTVTLTGPNSFSTTSSPDDRAEWRTFNVNVPAGSGYTATVNSHTLSNLTVTSGGTTSGTLNLNGGCS